jgi:hypothetical protein
MLKFLLVDRARNLTRLGLGDAKRMLVPGACEIRAGGNPKTLATLFEVSISSLKARAAFTIASHPITAKATVPLHSFCSFGLGCGLPL